MLRWVLALFLLLTAVPAANTAEIDGVAFPASRQVAGRTLILNGTALRTYSPLRVHIYVAALYLEQRSANAEQVLNSDQIKLVQFVFSRDIDAVDAQKSWQNGLDRNCQAPCRLEPRDVAQFLAAVPAVHRGESGSLLFTRAGLEISTDGRFVGRITDPVFSRVVLSTFIGPRSLVPAVRAGLLGGPS